MSARAVLPEVRRLECRFEVLSRPKTCATLYANASGIRTGLAQLHNAVWRLHPRALLTTNFDKLLEGAYANETRQAADLRRGLDVHPPDSLRREGVLFKLHGDLDDPSTLVLSRNDYLRSLSDRPC